MWTNPQETADLFTFTKEILTENVFCAVRVQRLATELLVFQTTLSWLLKLRWNKTKKSYPKLALTPSRFHEDSHDFKNSLICKKEVQ